MTELGYSIHPGIFSRPRMLDALAALDEAQLARTKAGARQILSVPNVRALANDEALLAIARGYIGPEAFPFRATLFDKSLSANWLVTWHQDRALPIRERREVAGWGPWTEKGGVLHAIAPPTALDQVVALRVHIDDSTLENGPLRVLPGTHSAGVLSESAISQVVGEATAIDCVVDAGGVIAMKPLLLHASSKARSEHPRRVIHIEYATTKNLAEGLELAVT
jgi:hypothetical protein